MIGSDLTLVGGTSSPPDSSETALLIVGVGNLLMGDEGVGIHVLRELQNSPALPGVRLLDGGTGGINLLESIALAPVVIMIDATRDGSPAGTITELTPDSVADLPRDLSAHDFGLRDLFAAAALLGQFPEIHLFTVSVETIRPMCLELSPPVAASVSWVVRAVQGLAYRLVAEQ